MSEIENERPVILFSKNEPSGNIGTDCDCDDGDCACSLPELIERPQLIRSETILHRITPSYIEQLNEQFYLCYSPFHKLVLLNKTAVDRLLFFEQARSYEQFVTRFGDEEEESDLFWSLVEQRLLKGANQPAAQLKEAPQTISAWLHITDRCNLRCSYCYLPHLKKDMSWEVGKDAIDATFRSAVKHRYSKVKLKYAGGEALLRFELIIQLHHYAIEQAELYQMELDGLILSNGTLLTPEMAKTIKELGLRLMISLDGLGHAHDAHRPYAGGRGSFIDVEKGIQIAKKAELWSTISVTVSGQNAAELPNLVDWILEQKLPFSLNFYRENELSSSHTELKLEEKKIVDGMLAAYKVIENNLPKESLLGSLVDRANLAGPHLKTCGVGQSYMVFDYLGGVAKCQMHLDQPVTTAKVEDPLGVIRLDMIGLQNISVEEKEGCRSCEWKYWCTGGCSLATFKATGRYDIQSPNCEIYKAIYPEAVRLEGLRILKYID